MKRLWISKFSREVIKQIKGDLVVSIENEHNSVDTELVFVVIYHKSLVYPFSHIIGTVETVLEIDPIEVAGSFVRYYREIIFNKFFKCIDKN